VAIKITLDRTAVRETPQRLVLPLVRKVGGQIEREARRMVRVRTGAVRGGIRSDLRVTQTKVTWTVGAYHRRAMLEHEGSPAHTISQRPGGPILTFYWEKVGRVVRFHSVNHPGTSGSKFLVSPLVVYAGRSGFRVSTVAGVK
jgi:hypothetical protein